MSKTVRTRTVKGYMKGYSNKSLSRFLDRLVTINHVEGKDNSKNSKLAANLTYAYIGDFAVQFVTPMWCCSNTTSPATCSYIRVNLASLAKLPIRLYILYSAELTAIKLL